MKVIRVSRILLCFGLWLGVTMRPVSAQAQTSGSAPTLTALTNLEQSLTAGDALPAPMNLPASVSAGLAGLSLDLRIQTNYSAAANSLTLTMFAVPIGSPAPTNLAQIASSSIIGSATINVDRVYVTGTAVMFVGSVSASSLTVFGNEVGAPATLSFAYSGDTPPNITNVTENLGGSGVLFSSTATGALTITKPGNTGTSTGSTVTVVVNPGANLSVNGTNSFQTESSHASLDGSKSTSSIGATLTYSWSAPPGTASIFFANTANPVIQFFTKGTYVITLTVTDATGATATQAVTVQYF